jgi:hypothetical protein
VTVISSFFTIAIFLQKLPLSQLESAAFQLVDNNFLRCEPFVGKERGAHFIKGGFESLERAEMFPAWRGVVFV